MEIKQDRSSNITFSLHDTRIKGIIFIDNKSNVKAIYYNDNNILKVYKNLI